MSKLSKEIKYRFKEDFLGMSYYTIRWLDEWKKSHPTSKRSEAKEEYKKFQTALAKSLADKLRHIHEEMNNLLTKAEKIDETLKECGKKLMEIENWATSANLGTLCKKYGVQEAWKLVRNRYWGDVDKRRTRYSKTKYKLEDMWILGTNLKRGRAMKYKMNEMSRLRQILSEVNGNKYEKKTLWNRSDVQNEVTEFRDAVERWISSLPKEEK